MLFFLSSLNNDLVKMFRLLQNPSFKVDECKISLEIDGKFLLLINGIGNVGLLRCTCDITMEKLELVPTLFTVHGYS